MDDETQTEVEPQEPVSIEQYGDGVVVRAANGKFLPGTRSPAPITHANARTFQALAASAGRRGQLRGLVKGAGLDPAEIDEELAAQAASAAEAFSAHLAKTFIKSNSLRGMGEVYNKIMHPLVGDGDQDAGDKPQVPAVLIAIQQIFKGKE